MPHAQYEVFTCVFGGKSVPRSRMHHLSVDPSPVDVIYPFWVVRRNGEGSVALIDTGFPAEVASKHQVENYVPPGQLIRQIGVEPQDVATIVVSHAHFDHFAGVENYPQATFHMQRAEVEYLAAHYEDHPYARVADETALGSIDALTRDGRLNLLDGTADVEPFRVHRTGGHTPGTQVIELVDAGPPLVFACDASHFFENLETRTPTTLIHSYEDYQSAFGLVQQLAHGGIWLPGHDPRMLEGMTEVATGVFRVERREDSQCRLEH